MSELKLVALLCSRLCHDLVGPVGAVANGVEILGEEDEPGMRQQAIELLGHSAAEASRRLAFFRLAFGAAGAAGDRVRLEEARQAAAGLYVTGRVRLDWPATPDDGMFDKGLIKLALNLVLLAGNALPRGGDVQLRTAPEAGGHRLTITASGAGAQFQDDIREALAQGIAEERLDTRNAVGQFVHELSGALNAPVTAEQREGMVMLAILLK